MCFTYVFTYVFYNITTQTVCYVGPYKAISVYAIADVRIARSSPVLSPPLSWEQA